MNPIRLLGMFNLTLAERGVFTTIMILIHHNGGPIRDNRLFIAAWCGCGLNVLNPILDGLIQAGRLVVVEEGGRAYLAAPDLPEAAPDAEDSSTFSDLKAATPDLFGSLGCAA